MQISINSDRLSTDALPRLVNWATAHDSVRAVLLTSTRAIPDGSIDVLSDYDVILVVKDIHPWVNERQWVNVFGEVVVAYWDPIHPEPSLGMEVCANVIQYTDGLKIDFTLWPVALLEQIAQFLTLPLELDAGYRILVDKDHLTESMQPPTGRAYIPKPPSLEEYQLLINDFLSDAPYVAKCLWRDELMPAKWCLDYDMKHIYLRPMLEWLVEIKHGWSQPVGWLGKGMKKHLPQDAWVDLEQTYTGAQSEANWAALERTLELFRRVARIVGESLGYHYPEVLHERVVCYVDRIRQLSY